MPPPPAISLQAAPFREILLIPMRYFQADLAERGLSLSSTDIRDLAQAVAAGPQHDKSAAIKTELASLVDQRLALLMSRWGLSFAQSLSANAADIAPWQTTADLLSLANTKAETETDIALGAVLLLALGRRDYGRFLIDLIENDLEQTDADAIIAARILAHASGIDHTQTDWLARAKDWLEALN